MLEQTNKNINLGSKLAAASFSKEIVDLNCVRIVSSDKPNDKLVDVLIHTKFQRLQVQRDYQGSIRKHRLRRYHRTLLRKTIRLEQA
jgi:hypothetical protein